MHLPRSSQQVTNFIWLDQIGSTNTELAARASADPALPHFTVLATDNQVAGKGRLGRVWSAPAGTALAVSILLKPRTPSGRPLAPEALGWMGLLAGLAMSRACTSLLPEGTRARLKWPNDVLVNDLKVCGILSEIVTTPDGLSLVVGTGVNVALDQNQLPVPTATSLALEGSVASIDDVLATYLQEFERVYNVFVAAEGNVETSGLLAEVIEACDTLGRSVRVELPSGDKPVGTATTIDPSGSLVVDLGSGLAPLVVAVGDVTHLRVLMKDAPSN